MTDGGDAVKTTTEGVVIDVNRSRKQITIRAADKKTQTLRVMDGTAPAGAHVVVSLADQAGAKTYDFKRVSTVARVTLTSSPSRRRGARRR